MKQRLIVAAIGIPLTLVVLLLAPVWCFAAAIGVVALLCAYELIKGAVRSGQRFLIVLAPILMLFLGTLVLIIYSGYPRYYLMIPFGCVYTCDACSMLFGSKFGKRHIFPKISPNKTEWGAVGGLIGSVLFTIIFGAIGHKYGLTTHMWRFALIGLTLGVAGEFGDLFFSAVKRICGIKDYSNILPGHGGFLDRFDSLIFAAPICVSLLNLLEVNIA
ncbi:MAG: phosphatidate cytidylyltransferase [Oscillospiraceae bacterium]|nr:phosphatidate cytidylyltransferase [Oscillospiraceae bacterium]